MNESHGEPEANSPPAITQGFLGHPPGLILLFFIEMWERFSYYGMKALLILYLVDALHWPVSRAASVYGSYTALAYIAPILGGVVADRFLGSRASLVWGGMIIALGHFTLALEHSVTFYLGLALVVIGTGLFKPNVSIMVGQLYPNCDGRRDAGFMIYFIGISVGAFLAPLACGYLGQSIGWNYGFSAAGLGMVMGLFLYLWGRNRYLPGIGFRIPAPPRIKNTPTRINAEDRSRITAALILVSLSIPFWACYEQFGSSLSLFADHHIDRMLGNFQVPASWFQSINPVVIIGFAPLLAIYLQRREIGNRSFSTPHKMALAYVLLAVGFGFATIAGFRSQFLPLVSPLWFVATDLFRSWGELLLSPVGLAYISKVAPARYGSQLMAAWLLAEGIGNKLAGVLASYSDIIPAGHYYAIFVLVALAAGIALIVLGPFINRLEVSGGRSSELTITN
jgi:POT family proton-dependent oligopeptide transporter